MPENFNFSKIEDQKKFENLPEKERGEVVGEAREEAVKLLRARRLWRTSRRNLKTCLKKKK